MFALGPDYAPHAREAGFELPPMPLTFTKFPSCLTGPRAEVRVACWLNGEEIQSDRTSSMLLSVSEVVARLSAVRSITTRFVA